jgi:hypothetical protein
LPTFGLNVHALEPELVERNYAVDASVAGTAHSLEVLFAGAVAQREQQVEHQLLEELGWSLSDLLEELTSDSAVDFFECNIDSFVWRGRHPRAISDLDPIAATLTKNPLAGLRIEPVRITREQLSTTIRDAPDSSRRVFHVAKRP